MHPWRRNISGDKATHLEGRQQHVKWSVVLTGTARYGVQTMIATR